MSHITIPQCLEGFCRPDGLGVHEEMKKLEKVAKEKFMLAVLLLCCHQNSMVKISDWWMDEWVI